MKVDQREPGTSVIPSGSSVTTEQKLVKSDVDAFLASPPLSLTNTSDLEKKNPFFEKTSPSYPCWRVSRGYASYPMGGQAGEMTQPRVR